METSKKNLVLSACVVALGAYIVTDGPSIITGAIALILILVFYVIIPTVPNAKKENTK